MDEIGASSFRVVGIHDGQLLSRLSAEDPTLVVIGNKLVRADQVVAPQLTINGQGPVALGELVILEAVLTGECTSFVQSAKISWTVMEGSDPKQCWNEGRKVIFGAGVKSARIDVTAKLTLTYMVDGAQVLKVVSATASVLPGGPTPGPDPGPTPEPNTLTGLAKLAYDWAKDAAVVQPDGLTLQTGARALSGSFKGVSNRVGQEGFKDMKSILLQTKVANNDALMAAGIDPRKWDAWGVLLQNYLFDKYQAKELVTADHLKKAWWDISVGLWGVK